MSGYGMFRVYFDDGTVVKIWCKKDEVHLEALKVCAEHNHYYNEHYLVTKIDLETESDDDE